VTEFSEARKEIKMGKAKVSRLESKLTVNFKTEWRSDGGLRIYATQPAGLYVSSSSTYAAAEYFERFIPVLTMFNLRSSKKGGFTCDYDFDWEKIVESGGGSLEVVSVPKEELDEIGPATSGTGGDFPPLADEQQPAIAETELKVDLRERSDGKPYFVIHDIGEPDPVLEDIIRRQETVQ
jgi:hypothetical protein